MPETPRIPDPGLTAGDIGGLLEAVRYRVANDLEVDEREGMARRYTEIEDKLRAALSAPQEGGDGGSSGVEVVGSAVPGDPQNAAYSLPQWLTIYAGRIQRGEPVAATESDRGMAPVILATAASLLHRLPQFSDEADPQHSGVEGAVEEALNSLARWMVDYEGEEGGPVETRLSWISGPDGDPTTRRPDVGDYLVKLSDVLAAIQPFLAQPEVASMLAEFHERFNYEKTADPSLRLTLHEEEHRELVEALEAGELEPIARELADVVYVAYGSAWSLGIDLDAAIREVHRANMSKLGDDGQPVYREDGKVLKGPNFRPPDLRLALEGHPVTIDQERGGIFLAASPQLEDRGGVEAAARALCANAGPGFEDDWTKLDDDAKDDWRRLATVALQATPTPPHLSDEDRERLSTLATIIEVNGTTAPDLGLSADETAAFLRKLASTPNQQKENA